MSTFECTFNVLDHLKARGKKRVELGLEGFGSRVYGLDLGLALYRVRDI